MWFAVLTVLSDYNRSRSGVVRKTKLLLQIRFPHIFRGDSVPPCAVSVAHDQPGWREFSPVVLPVSTHSGFMFPQYKPLFWKTINFESTGNSDAKNNHEIYISYIPSWRKMCDAGEFNTNPKPTAGGPWTHSITPHFWSPDWLQNEGVHTCASGCCEGTVEHTCENREQTTSWNPRFLPLLFLLCI